MLQRQSALFLPTLREDPADAEAVSHRLLVRAGLIRQVGAGLWTYLPAGWRVHEKVVQIVREEMDAIGGQEMSMPVLTPAELWQRSGRYDKFDVLMKLRDSSEREFVLAATHEETVTFHARELRSYRDLPKILYHFQTKERDEQRPRGGLLRVREFVMKDAYSFDRDEEGLDRAFQAHEAAYERIFERCGLEAVAVAGRVGDDGRQRVDRLPGAVGLGREHARHVRARRLRRRSRDRARRPARAVLPGALDAPAEVETPGIATCEDLAGFLGIDLAATSKAMPVVATARSCSRSCAATTGSTRRSSPRCSARPPAPRTRTRSARRSAPSPARSAPSASAGGSCSTRRCGRDSSSPARTAPASTCAASQHGRDFEAEVADIRLAREGDACPRCGGALRFQTAIEVGHIFKLGTFYSVPLDATYLDEQSVERPIVMGSYGIGPAASSRPPSSSVTTSAGSSGPRPIAPYDVHVLSLSGGADEARGARRRRSRTTSPRRATTSCSTTATHARARSSPTPTCSAARSGSRSAARSLEDGAVDVRRRTDGCGRARPSRVCD